MGLIIGLLTNPLELSSGPVESSDPQALRYQTHIFRGLGFWDVLGPEFRASKFSVQGSLPIVSIVVPFLVDQFYG